MLRHLLKLMWKRKTRNLMLSLELLLAFVLVFALSAIAVRCWQLYHEPVGFDYRPLWAVEINPGDGQRMPKDADLYTRLRLAVRELPEVEHSAFTTFAPYTMRTMTTSIQRTANGPGEAVQMLEVSDDFFATNGMTPVAGQWFSSADDGAGIVPVVINQHMADRWFPGQAAVGRTFTGAENDTSAVRYRVAAVLEAYRTKGELDPPSNLMLTRHAPDGSLPSINSMLLRIKPGTPRSFETALQRQLKLVRNDWSFTISPLADLRASLLKQQLAPLLVLAVIAAFLLVMVAFGLFGVLWQNTTRRIPEIGLRRALGAPSGAIHRQIVGEQMLLSTFAMLAGLALLVQLPLTGVLGEHLNWSVFIYALGLSMGLIYLLSLLCSLYPGWHASRMPPTSALRYE
ncbi:FtsX-like permease family protein [Duganella sp. FT92W]|uniref:FtsX-like permease family protein n=1 Tax=Pseudoduganella rivuli TaxID=2666085 RepID=A0A7X2LSQ8_9BURK|nr:FtsX-like permease family protein [Pseudoduganella rivuli]MRV71162.1 FtsX-like permease family protein [Pseudoduganella rivuli]